MISGVIVCGTSLAYRACLYRRYDVDHLVLPSNYSQQLYGKSEAVAFSVI